MYLSECIIFSVNTTVHGSCPEQSVKQLQVFPALYMELCFIDMQFIVKYNAAVNKVSPETSLLD